jgi:sugar (pentulose or hexulose) kinase
MRGERVGVLDVGKSNTRLLVVDGDTGELAWRTECASVSVVREGLRQLDVHRVEGWLLNSLRGAPEKHRIRAIVPVAHGAAAVLLDANGNVLAAPDYEDPEFETVAEAYRRERDPFETTFSPFLPVGLNLGRQLFYLQSQRPKLWARCEHILLHPQYWAWRLSRALASEVTSLGCHTDLWSPGQRCFSPLAERSGWAAKMPRLRSAFDVVGAVASDVAAHAGLDVECRVLCGIHDSNASYYGHLVDQPHEQPFAVIASGTWTIVMARGVELARLQPQWDMLANVDALGSPIGTARFMGGREYEVIAGADGTRAEPSRGALERLIGGGVMALPSFVEAGGPFGARRGRLLKDSGLDATERASLASLYCALVTDLILERLDARGPVVIDGPLAANPLFSPLLATLDPTRHIVMSRESAGTVYGALRLAGYGRSSGAGVLVPKLEGTALRAYRDVWRVRAAEAP